jgi:hypothetical protein
MFQDLPEGRRTTSRLRTTACIAYQRTATAGATVAGRGPPAGHYFDVKMTVVTFVSPIPATLAPGNLSSESMLPW